MKPSRQLLEHALLLIARQHGGDAATAEAAGAALVRWRQADPAHEAAAQAALRGWAATEARELQGEVPLPPAQAIATRRRVMTALGFAGLAVAVGGGTRWYWLQPLEQLALETGHGQLLARQLADGSLLDLAPLSRAQAILYRDRREVRLAQGEVRFDVKHDADRPFDVLTDWGRVRVLGTAFTVAVRERRMTVSVAHGRVAVWSDREGQGTAAAPDALLTAGQSVHADAAGLGQVDAVEASHVGAWRQGWLVFDHTPLPEAVARWNDYLAQPIALADGQPALRELRLTGSFPVRDPAAFIASLPRVLPVTVEREAPQGVHTIRLR